MQNNRKDKKQMNHNWSITAKDYNRKMMILNA